MINPFMPYQPIDPTRFVGRSKEIGELEAALFHAKKEYPRHFLITGDRGIGKTSFFDYMRKTARSYSNTQDISFNFIVVDLVIDKTTTRLDLVRKITRGIDYELNKIEPVKGNLGKVWEFIQRIEALGISLKSEQEDNKDYNTLYDELGYSLINIVDKFCTDNSVDSLITDRAYDGIMMLLDEADQASPSLSLGSFIKYLLEFLRRHNCNKVIFGLAGLPSVIDVLLDSHRSSLRIFDELPLPCLQYKEVMTLLDEIVIGFQEFELDEFIITDGARRRIWEFSDGHPQFCHQIGYCAYEIACADADEKKIVLDEDHVLRGALNERGAVDIIGDVYFKDTYEAFRESEYVNKILRYIIENDGFLVDHNKFITNDFLDKKLARESFASLERAGLLFHNTRRDEFRLKYSCFAYWFSSKYPGVIV